MTYGTGHHTYEVEKRRKPQRAKANPGAYGIEGYQTPRGHTATRKNPRTFKAGAAVLDAFGNRGKVVDVFPGRGGFYKVQYPDGSTGYVDIKDARSSRAAPKQNPKRPKPSEQSRLYAAAADLHRQALASGDRAAIQRANALWSQGHSARRNPGKFVYEITFERMWRGKPERERIGLYTSEGVYWTEAAAKKALRKLKAEWKGEPAAATLRVEKRGVFPAERLARVTDAAKITYPRDATWEDAAAIRAKRGRFTVYVSGPHHGEVLARFPTRGRAEVYAKHARDVYGADAVWVESPGSIEAKLRRMDAADGLV